MVEANMYTDQITGNWHIFKGKVRQRWAEFTNEDLDHVIGGFEEELSGKIQTIYGISKEKADREIKEWLMSDHDPHYWSGGASSGGGGSCSSV
ncbi:hypothetical protein NB231_08645 [Nitrococcus mobilis Nb-231]|uniref:CsbD-like domain-containing protein n=2 Tax=Nitrococcus mobilis TaxID=35797 RepID=A4BSP2_9GAMM|nr:hypothetical protein NB231_08645 [Nitrococcus mobilis Nb-231]